MARKKSNKQRNYVLGISLIVILALVIGSAFYDPRPADLQAAEAMALEAVKESVSGSAGDGAEITRSTKCTTDMDVAKNISNYYLVKVNYGKSLSNYVEMYGDGEDFIWIKKHNINPQLYADFDEEVFWPDCGVDYFN